MRFVAVFSEYWQQTSIVYEKYTECFDHQNGMAGRRNEENAKNDLFRLL